jgi:hypothetical protein
VISQADLDRFYEGLVTEVRVRGGTCAIAGGMACVQYGVGPSTRGCDVLSVLLDVIGEADFLGVRGWYRGHVTAPLDRRWLAGGWTSHFEWPAADAKPRLDVFGVAPRASTHWSHGISGLLAGMHTVAEMKRTDRGKDWPFASALGSRLIECGDLRGWLHIFDAETLEALLETAPLPDEMVAQRPALQLLRDRDPRLRLAVFGEMTFWRELDRRRLRLHEAAARNYTLAVKRDPKADVPDLHTQHAVRLRHAEALLPHCPILDYGIERLIADAKQSANQLLAPGVLEWLPNIAEHFFGLRCEPT